jgi:hypothetical protein
MVARRRAPRALKTLALVTAGVLLVLSAPAGAQTGDGAPSMGASVRVARLAPSAVPSGSTGTGATSSAQAVSLEVVLPPSNPAGLSAALAALDDPSSPQYHHWLTPAEFAARFGPSATAVTRVDDWLGGVGMHLSRPSTFAVRASAPAGAVESGLGVSLRNYALDGRHFYAADRAPLVPSGVSGDVVALLGLDTEPQLHAALEPHRAGTAGGPGALVPDASGASVPHADGLTPCGAATTAASQTGSFTPDQVGSEYHIGTVTAAGENGAGSTVAVYELAPHLQSDVSTYETCFGLDNTVTKVTVDTGGTPDPGGTVEADADIEEVATQAPGASILSYEGPNSAQGAFDTWSAIVSQNSASVISTSWGECEPSAAQDGSLTADDMLFQEAAAQGQTVVAATGDSGSEDCLPASAGTDTSLEVDFPSSDPSVTAVGGTTFTSGGASVAWNDCEGAVGPSCATLSGDEGSGGGGISQYAVRPSWQPADWEWGSATFACGTNCRDTPDLAANAGSGEVFFANSGWGSFVGTSIASPVIAGLVGDVSGGCTAPRKGILGPVLYGLVAQDEYGSALTDVTSGDNDLTRTYTGTRFPATSGYDTTSGVGTPLAPGWSCPEVSSVSPTSGAAGQQVTVTGLGLEKATITFAGVSAAVVSETATAAVVIAPSTGGAGGATRVQGSSAWGTGTASGTFAYASAPPPPPPPPPQAKRTGYDLVGSDGGVFVFPTGQSGGFFGSLPGLGVHVDNVVGMVLSPDVGGYFLVGSDGGVFAFGDAPFEGSLPGLGVRVNDIKGIVPTADDGGYFLVGSDGGVFAFGDARFLGSLPGIGAHVDDVVGIAAAPGDLGYWVVESDGAVHAFGTAPAFGSLTNATAPVTDIVSSPDGDGYWVVTQNGGVTPFGDAVFDGSLPFIGASPTRPVISLVPTSGGYWLIGSDGGIFAFGAPFVGSLPGLGVAVSNVVGAVPN